MTINGPGAAPGWRAQRTSLYSHEAFQGWVGPFLVRWAMIIDRRGYGHVNPGRLRLRRSRCAGRLLGRGARVCRAAAARRVRELGGVRRGAGHGGDDRQGERGGRSGREGSTHLLAEGAGGEGGQESPASGPQRLRPPPGGRRGGSEAGGS